MRYTALSYCALFLLFGCTQAQENVEKATLSTVKEINKTTTRLRTYFAPPATKQAVARPVPATYCYRAMGDIVCYDRPLPGERHRLVGAQGSVEYRQMLLDAEAHQDAINNVPPPSHVTTSAVAAPPAKMASSKSTFVKPPPAVKAVDTTSTGEPLELMPTN